MGLQEWRANKTGKWNYKPVEQWTRGELIRILNKPFLSSHIQLQARAMLDEIEREPRKRRQRISPYESRDEYLISWFTNRGMQNGEPMRINNRLFDGDKDLPEDVQRERLATGQVLLEVYDPLVSSLAKYPEGITNQAWDSEKLLVKEPNSKECLAIYPNKNPYVLQRELYAELQTWLLETAHRWDPDGAIFSRYLNESLKWAAHRYIIQEVDRWGFGSKVHPILFDSQELSVTEDHNCIDDQSNLCAHETDFGECDFDKNPLDSDIDFFLDDLLTQKQRQIFDMYYLDNYEQVHIAELLGVTRAYVSKTIKVINKKLSQGKEENNFRNLLQTAKYG
jgi:RNA polymerase sigma factor (sigma-70 family)